MRLSYVGPYEEVDVPDLGISTKRAAPFDATDEQVKALKDQSDVWHVLDDLPTAPTYSPGKGDKA